MSFVQMMVNKLQVGQCIDFGGHRFREDFRCGYPSIYNTSVQSFLSKQIGAAWGSVTCVHDEYNDVYRVCKHEVNEQRRVYVDPDRECLYEFVNGEYVFKGV